MRAGALILAVGVLKLAVGVVVYREELARIARAGVFGAVQGDQSVGAAAVWFLFAGGLLVLLGAVVLEGEREGRPPSLRTGIGLVAVGLGAVALMPASGAWLLLPLGGWIAWRARRAS
ncbi:MAG: hypothetical protein HY909_20355 [Deltaproteobacteria bacterium]|nr:hypothetical protein [Deltaproteobacteria bacterium]